MQSLYAQPYKQSYAAVSSKSVPTCRPVKEGEVGDSVPPSPDIRLPMDVDEVPCRWLADKVPRLFDSAG